MQQRNHRPDGNREFAAPAERLGRYQMPNLSRKLWLTAGLGGMLVAVACGTSSTPNAGSVRFLAVWTGQEQASFMAVLKPFEDQTGIKVDYEASRDQDAILTTRVAAGNPPDVASAPSPALLTKFAQAGKITPLDGVLNMNTLKAQYPQSWIDLGMVNGHLDQVFVWGGLKGLIWYDPKNFQAKGYKVPQSWNDLLALDQTIKAGGTTPWCVGVESGSASGWAGGDFIKEIALSQSGPAFYDNWWQGKVKWTSPEVKLAWQTWGSQILGSNDSSAYGGSKYIVSTNFGDAGTPLFANPPKCYLHNQASFITTFFTSANPQLQAGTDFKFFPLPDISSQYAGSHVVVGDSFSLFKDTPQARKLIQYLTTAQAQSIWVKRGGKLAINNQVSLSDYPDPLSQSIAQILIATKIAKFDAWDLMPPAMESAAWKGVLDFVSDQSKLDSILASLDQVQATAYTS